MDITLVYIQCQWFGLFSEGSMRVTTQSKTLSSGDRLKSMTWVRGLNADSEVGLTGVSGLYQRALHPWPCASPRENVC